MSRVLVLEIVDGTLDIPHTELSSVSNRDC
jgi:hypothetical protein